jgi:hypothetical protein
MCCFLTTFIITIVNGEQDACQTCALHIAGAHLRAAAEVQRRSNPRRHQGGTETVPPDAPALLPGDVHEALHQEQLLPGEEPHNCQFPRQEPGAARCCSRAPRSVVIPPSAPPTSEDFRDTHASEYVKMFEEKLSLQALRGEAVHAYTVHFSCHWLFRMLYTGCEHSKHMMCGLGPLSSVHPQTNVLWQTLCCGV